MSPLGERLRDRRWDTFEAAVGDAIAAGSAGDAELVAVLGELGADRQVLVVVALGDAAGDAGPSALRAVLGTERKQDLLCAALLALAKRCGGAASADLLTALASRNAAVKDYAVVGLAGAGDDRAWDVVFARLRRQLGNAASRSPHIKSSSVAAAICYLGRHLAGDRCAFLVAELRRRWGKLTAGERDWLTAMWPEVGPGGPAADAVHPPDPAIFRDWIRDPIFEPVYKQGGR